MKKNCFSFFIVIIFLFLTTFGVKITVNAEEQAQVVYDFMEVTEDTTTYVEPNYESNMGEIIPKGEKVLIISTTADGWYQILYHDEILYFTATTENLENIVISEDVVKEMEQKKEETQNLTIEEMEVLVDEGIVTSGLAYEEIISEKEMREKNQKTEVVPKILLGFLFITVVISGIGFLVLKKKEDLEQIKETKQKEIVIENLDAEDDK